MTTIAFDNNIIAWDSRIVVGDEYYDTHLNDKVRVHRGKIFASCGHAGMLDFLIPWWEKGAKWNLLPDYSDLSDDDKPSWELLVITPTERLSYSATNKGAVHRLPEVFAIGSGGIAARAAMLCGVSPAEAVSVAAKVLHGTGGYVNQLSINDNVKRVAARGRKR